MFQLINVSRLKSWIKESTDLLCGENSWRIILKTSSIELINPEMSNWSQLKISDKNQNYRFMN